MATKQDKTAFGKLAVHLVRGAFQDVIKEPIASERGTLLIEKGEKMLELLEKDDNHKKETEKFCILWVESLLKITTGCASKEKVLKSNFQKKNVESLFQSQDQQLEEFSMDSLFVKSHD